MRGRKLEAGPAEVDAAFDVGDPGRVVDGEVGGGDS